MLDPYEALAAADAARHRSSSGVGPSGFFGSECATTRIFAGHPPINPNVDKLAAIVGTAIHSALEVAYAGTGKQEIPVSYAGITGHVDYLPDDEPDVVVDWKTTTLAKIARYRQKGISKTYRAQGSFYAVATGRSRVRMVFIPKDGGRKDIWICEFPVDVPLVYEAITWFYEMKARAARGELAPPTTALWAGNRNARDTCARFCEFHDPAGQAGCPGPPPPEPPPPPADGSPFHLAAPPPGAAP